MLRMSVPRIGLFECAKFTKPSIVKSFNGLLSLWQASVSFWMDTPYAFFPVLSFSHLFLGETPFLTISKKKKKDKETSWLTFVLILKLFASNMALPMIDYVYWQTDLSTTNSTAINISTLAGTLFGQLLFGFLADKNGRKKMYGVELLLLITSTLGVAMASTGVHDSMSIFSWLIFWRIMVGIGVGGDYPLSAVITSEYDLSPLLKHTPFQISFRPFFFFP
jgi:MFS family permease